MLVMHLHGMTIDTKTDHQEISFYILTGKTGKDLAATSREGGEGRKQDLNPLTSILR